MNTRHISYLALAAAVLWGWFCWTWHCTWIRGACGEKIEVKPPPVVQVNKAADGSVLYNWMEVEKISDADFQKLKASILAGKTEDNILEITGLYLKDDASPEGFDNLGLARADAARKLFSADIPEERIRLKSSIDDSGVSTNNPLNNVKFNWIATKVEEAEVVQLKNKVIILFPFNSTVKENNPEIDKYLSDLAEQLKSLNKTVTLTGHTDNKGDEAYNENLGLQRARSIGAFLLSKGVKSEQIKVASKGEKEPVATNESDAGRHQNRRTEVVIN